MPSEQSQNCWVPQGMWHNQNLWLPPHTAPASRLLSNSDSSAPKSPRAVKSVAGNKTSCFLSIPQVSYLLVLNILSKLALLRRMSHQPQTQVMLQNLPQHLRACELREGRGAGSFEADRQALNGQSPEAKSDRKSSFSNCFSISFLLYSGRSCE